MRPWRGLQVLADLLIACFGASHIAAHGRIIEALARAIRAGPHCDAQVYLLDDRRLDVIAIAVAARVGPEEIERRLANRRRQTARDAKWCLLGAAWFLTLWLYETLRSSASFTSLGYVFALVGTCVVFSIIAFHNALINWQIRTRRLGTVREFLNTRDSWWPI
jgi:hypothetical protein